MVLESAMELQSGASDSEFQNPKVEFQTLESRDQRVLQVYLTCNSPPRRPPSYAVAYSHTVDHI